MIINTEQKDLGGLIVKLAVALRSVSNRIAYHGKDAVQLSYSIDDFARKLEDTGRELIPVEYGKPETVEEGE